MTEKQPIKQATIIYASARKESLNRKLAEIVRQKLLAQNILVEMPDYATLDMPSFNDDARHAGKIPPMAEKLRHILQASNCLIIASPEYNWSFPGSLKNVIDWISHFRPTSLEEMPIFLLSASTSNRGGVAGLMQLRVPFDALGAYVFPSAFTLGDAAQAFDKQGNIKDKSQEKALEEMLNRFLIFVKKTQKNIS